VKPLTDAGLSARSRRVTEENLVMVQQKYRTDCTVMEQLSLNELMNKLMDELMDGWKLAEASFHWISIGDLWHSLG
jgi:hypothetical protein